VERILTGVKARDSCAAWPARWIMVASCNGSSDNSGLTSAVTSSVPSASTQATFEFLDILAVNVVINISPPPTNSFSRP
jgi:hypothetical protein